MMKNFDNGYTWKNYGSPPFLCGFTADLPNNKIGFNPAVADDVKSVWSVATGWGTVEVCDGTFNLEIKDGYILLKELHLPFAKNIKSLSVDGNFVDFNFKNESLIFKQTKIVKNILVEFDK